MALTPNRSLLNPRFEGYKFKPVESNTITRHELQYKPSQMTVGSALSFQEMQSRITHNHLAVAPDGARAVYIDADYRVILVTLNPDTFQPHFQVAFELPLPSRTTSNDARVSEYPSAAFLTPTCGLVADGYDCMYTFRIHDADVVKCDGPFTLPKSSSNSAPFRIHSAVMLPTGAGVAVLSSRSYNEAEASTPSSQAGKTHKPVRFVVWGVRFPLVTGGAFSLEVLWRRQGDEVPIAAKYFNSRKMHLLIGGSPYLDQPSRRYEPTPDEMAPVPRLGEDLDAMTATATPAKPPPYSWSQTADTVTVAFPLPSATPKGDIEVTFSTQSLTVRVAGETPSSTPAVHYPAKDVWDGIRPTSSYWTWDREGDHAFGLLTLHLDKQHEGTKWMQVFAKAGALASSESAPEDVEVPETLDPSELWQIREALEKYTAALRDGEDASGLGLGRGVPSLAEAEMDDEVDASIGREAILTWVNANGSTPAWARDRPDGPTTILSMPLPGSEDDAAETTSLIAKTGLDGAVFTLNLGTEDERAPEWTHSETYSALAFVLASKQDTRFTYHVPSKAVLAFESGARDRGGNVYVYHAHPVHEKWAQESVLRALDAQGGALLGVGMLKSKSGKEAMIILSERLLILAQL